MREEDGKEECLGASYINQCMTFTDFSTGARISPLIINGLQSQWSYFISTLNSFIRKPFLSRWVVGDRFKVKGQQMISRKSNMLPIPDAFLGLYIVGHFQYDRTCIANHRYLICIATCIAEVKSPVQTDMGKMLSKCTQTCLQIRKWEHGVLAQYKTDWNLIKHGVHAWATIASTCDRHWTDLFDVHQEHHTSVSWEQRRQRRRSQCLGHCH